MVDPEPEIGGNHDDLGNSVEYNEISDDESGDRSVKNYHQGLGAAPAATNSGESLPGQELGLDGDMNIPARQGDGRQGASGNNGESHPVNNQMGFNRLPPPLSPYLPSIWKRKFGVPSPEMQRATDIFMSVSMRAPVNRQKITELAQAAAMELLRKATSGAPLWEPDSADSRIEVLNNFEYMKEFGADDLSLEDIMKMVEVTPKSLPSLDGTHEEENCGPFDFLNNALFGNEPNREASFETEASRAYCYTRMNPLNIIEMLMDLDQWSSIFSNIVGRGLSLGMVSTGSGENYNGALQVVSAAFHYVSPLVRSRECIFARYCKQLDLWSWLVVDVSLESIIPDQLNTYRRKPSGCLIQTFPNGFTRVVWVEHAEVVHGLVPFAFKPLVTSGFAFSAKRWISTLLQQIKRLMTIMGLQTNPTYDEENCKIWNKLPEAGKGNLLKLSERMMRSFCLGLGGTDTENYKLWRTIRVEGHEDVKVATRHSIDNPTPGNPPKITILFTASFWLAVPPKRVFSFLRDPNCRSKWDVLSSKLNVSDLMYVVHGEDPGSRVSVLVARKAPSNGIATLYVQESYASVTGSYIVYAPIEMAAMSSIMTGTGDVDEIVILPSGFVILPDRPIMDEDEVIGSVLTLGYHVVDGASSPDHIPPASVSVIHKLLTRTVSLIRSAVVSDDNSSNSQAVRRNAVKRRRST